MFSYVVTGLTEGLGAILRSKQRKRLLAAAVARADELQKSGRNKTLVIVNSPDDMRGRLSSMPNDSAVIFVNGALEYCDGKDDIEACWNHVKRVAGNSKDVFVAHIQPWSSGRLLDPRIRWVIQSAPPKSTDLIYKPYGRRSTALADAKSTSRAARTLSPKSIG